MSHQYTGYEYQAILRANRLLGQRIRVQEEHIDPLRAELAQCNLNIGKLFEGKA